jgi:signal transduction histidine kinase
VHLDIHGTADVVDILVMNGPPVDGVASLHTLGGGHGLRGMQERVRSCGGAIDMGPTREGGWEVAVSLPCRRATHTA